MSVMQFNADGKSIGDHYFLFGISISNVSFLEKTLKKHPAENLYKNICHYPTT